MILDEHLSVPMTGNFIQYLPCLCVLDCAADSIVSAREPALCLEFNVCNEVVLGAADIAVVTEFKLQLAD